MHTHSWPLGSWLEQNSCCHCSQPQALSYHLGNAFLRMPPKTWFWVVLIMLRVLRQGPSSLLGLYSRNELSGRIRFFPGGSSLEVMCLSYVPVCWPSRNPPLPRQSKATLSGNASLTLLPHSGLDIFFILGALGTHCILFLVHEFRAQRAAWCSLRTWW